MYEIKSNYDFLRNILTFDRGRIKSKLKKAEM